jgi:predicted enzyme related to lactoylglutathione lyase
MASATNPVMWFEIPVSDIDRATAFYEKVLGVSLSPLNQGGFKMGWFPRAENGHGSSGALVQAEGRTPGKAGTLVYLVVPDVDAALTTVQELGGRVMLPRTSGDSGSIAHFEDSEGNLVALMSL